MRFIAIVFSTLFVISCASHSPKPEAKGSTINDIQADDLLRKGFAILVNGDPNQAITGYFNPVIAFYESTFAGQQIFCARTQQESLLYLVTAAKEKKSAKVLNQNWAQAYFFKAYSYVELGNPTESELWLNKALALSPGNSSYYSELAHLYQIRKDWNKSIELFEKAQKYAQTTSPDEVKIVELLRAKRGSAYSLVELGRLEEAAKKYRECLSIDPNDKKSQMELEYVQNLKSKSI